MAQMRYFFQDQQLTSIAHDGAASSKAHHFSGLLPDGRRVNAERRIERKNNPSNHKCGPRCMNATGFLCECSCGGKNHGGANFSCTSVAA